MGKLDQFLARQAAAGGLMKPGSPEMPMPDELGAPPGGMESPMPPPDAPELDGIISQLDGALESVEPKIAEEARTHLNAIRELVSIAEPQVPPEGEPDLEAEGPDSAEAALPPDENQVPM